MREILFRGKRVDNGEWVYGYYTELPEGDIGATLMVGSDELLCEDTAAYIVSIETKQCPSFSPAYPIQVFDADLCKVCPETVGQYTGLTDKNGKKIFEGDIIAIDEDSIYYHTASGPVRTYKGMWVSFYLPDAHGRDCYDELYRINAEREVIGNIHDNPELLKEDKQ